MRYPCGADVVPRVGLWTDDGAPTAVTVGAPGAPGAQAPR